MEEKDLISDKLPLDLQVTKIPERTDLFYIINNIWLREPLRRVIE